MSVPDLLEQHVTMTLYRALRDASGLPTVRRLGQQYLAGEPGPSDTSWMSLDILDMEETGARRDTFVVQGLAQVSCFARPAEVTGSILTLEATASAVRALLTRKDMPVKAWGGTEEHLGTMTTGTPRLRPVPRAPGETHGQIAVWFRFIVSS